MLYQSKMKMKPNRPLNISSTNPVCCILSPSFSFMLAPNLLSATPNVIFDILPTLGTLVSKKICRLSGNTPMNVIINNLMKPGYTADGHQILLFCTFRNAVNGFQCVNRRFERSECQ